MLNKFFLYLLICLICLSKNQYPILELKQFGQKTLNYSAFLYLSLEGFDKGSKVNLELQFNNRANYSEISLFYLQSNTTNLASDQRSFSSYTSRRYTRNRTFVTFFFTIKLIMKSDFLILLTPF